MWTVGFHVQSIRKLVGSVALTPLWRCLSTPPMTATYMSEDDDANYQGKICPLLLTSSFPCYGAFSPTDGMEGEGKRATTTKRRGHIRRR